MLVADIHPSVAELEAFALGTLDGDSLAAVEAHVADCPSCQERAAAGAGDNLVDVLRRVHVRMTCHTDTAVQSQTPGPVAPADAGKGINDSGLIPQELVGHERYRVVSLLGKGGMGSVYHAEHRVMRRLVAVKVINSAFTSRPSAVARFRREVRAAAQLSHPNIVTTYDAEDAGNTLFLVMEYVEGISLARLVEQQGPLPVAEACDCIRQAALGLQHAHERSLVHRDVKPDNLIRTADGVVKVLDFGLAALTAEHSENLTESNLVVGTPDYMAPEQAAAPHEADIRADVYSLGCTLYYLLTGKVPFPAPTSLLKIIAHRDQPPPAIRETRPDVPPEVDEILSRMLARQPDDRYQTPGEVAAALQTFASAEETKKYHMAQRRRTRIRRVAAAVLFLMLLVVGAVYRVQTDRGELVITTESDDVDVVIKQGGKIVHVIDTRTDKRVTLHSGVYELELSGGDGLKLDIDKATLTRGDTVVAKIERVRKEAAPVVAKGPDPADDPAVKVIQPLHRFPFGGGDRFYSVDITQDGRFVLAARGKTGKPRPWGREGSVRVWDVQSGELVREFEGTVARIAADGSHAIATSWNEFNVYELPSGKLIRNFTTPEQCWGFWLSPEGTTLYNSTPLNQEVYDWATGKLHSRFPRREEDQPWVMTPDGRRLLSNEKPPLRVVDTATGQEVDDFQQLRDLPLLNHFSADGKRLACYAEGRLKIFDTGTAKLVAEIEGPSGALSGDGRLLLKRNVKGDGFGVWDVDSGRHLARLEFPAPVDWQESRISRDGRFATFAGPGDFVYVFRLPEPLAKSANPPAGQKVGEVFRQHWDKCPITSGVDLSPDGRRLLSTHWGGVRVWDIATGKPLHEWRGWSSQFTVDGKQIVTLTPDDERGGSLRLYDTASGKLVREFAPHPVGLNGAYVCPDGRTVGSGGKDGIVRLWDLNTGERVERDDPWPVVWGDKEVPSLAKRLDLIPDYVLPGGREVMFRGLLDGRFVRIHEISSGRLVRKIPLAETGQVEVVGISAGYGHNRMAFGLADGTILVVDLVTGKEVARFSAGSFQPKTLAISGDDRFVAACPWNEKGDLIVWRLPEPPPVVQAKP